MSSSETQRRSPYQGLIPYREQDAPFFFGREKEARLITANLFASPLTLLYGTSGVGKSSVLRAGVAHSLRLRKDVLVVVFNAWQGNPINELKSKINEVANQTNGVMNEVSDSLSLAEFLVVRSKQLNRRLMIVLDQFEEYFLYHPHDDSFASEFSQAVTQCEASASFLISIREDFYAKLDRFEGRIPTLYDNYLRIEHLDYKSARVATEAPIDEYNRLYAKAGNQFSLEPALVEAVLKQVETGRVIFGESGRGVIEAAKSPEDVNVQIETPFLQLVMTRLWDEEIRSDSHRLQLATLQKLGGAQNIVRTHLDAVMANLTAGEQEIAASIFHYLVTPSGTKIAYSAPDLAASAGLNEAQVMLVLEKLTFGEVRILRPVDSGLEGSSAPRYEIFHDVLAPAILAWRTNYVQAQTRAETEKQLALEAEARTRAQQQLARERRLVARQRWMLVGLAAVLVLMGFVTVWAFQQQRKANQQTRIAADLQTEAEEQRKFAEQQKDVALGLRAEAEKAKGRADEQAEAAKRASQEADKQRKIAEQSATVARAAQQKEADQQQKTQKALDAARAALRERDIAETKRQEQEDINQLRTEAEEAKVPLETDPKLSLSRAKAVLDKLHERRIQDPASANKAEDVLRRALLALDESNVAKILPRQTESVEGVFFSPKGDLLVTTTADGVAHIWDTREWEKRTSLPPGKAITKVIFNSSGTHFLTDRGDDSFQVWAKDSLATPLRSFEGSNPIFRADAQTVLFVDPEGKIQQWKLGDQLPVEILHPAPLSLGRRGFQREATLISPDGKLALWTTQGEGAQLWELDTPRNPLKSSQIDSPPQQVLFSNDSRYIAAIYPQQLLLLDLTDWRTAALPPSSPQPSPTPGAEATSTPEPEPSPITLPLPGKSGVILAEFNPADSNSLLTLSADGMAFLYNIREKEGEQILQGQTSDVVNALFTPTGEYILLLGSDGLVRIWNVETEALFATLRGHEGPVLSAAFSPIDGSLVTASYDQTVRVWEWKPKTWRANPVIIGGSDDLTAAFSDDGRSVLTTDTNVARIWPVEGGEKPAAEFPGVQSTFSADGNLVATAIKVPIAQLFDAGSGQSRLDLNGHTAEVRTAVFSNDGRYLLTASDDKTARVWDVKKGTAVVLGGHEGRMVSAAFSADASLVITVTQNGPARVWQWQSEAGRAHPFEFKIPPVRRAAISSDGRWLATTGGKDVRLWNAQTGKQLTMMSGFKSLVTSIAFSPDSKRLLGMDVYGVRVLNIAAPLKDINPGTELAVVGGVSSSALARPVQGAAFSPDSNFVLTGGGRLVQVWDVSGPAPRRVAFASLTERILEVAYGPKGDYIAASSVPDGLHAFLRVWKVPATNSVETNLGKEVALMRDIPYFRASSPGIAFSADERLIMVADGAKRLALFDWQSESARLKPTVVRGKVAALSPDGQTVFSSWLEQAMRVQETKERPGASREMRVSEGSITQLVFRPDNGMLAVGVRNEKTRDDEVWLWEREAPNRITTIPLPEEGTVNQMSFSPDGRLLAIGTINELLLYNVKDKLEVPLSKEALGGHKDEINDVQFSADSKYVVTASDDRTARVWDVEARKVVLLLSGHFEEVKSASFSRDGGLIVTTSNDKTARVWKWKPPERPGTLAQLVDNPLRLEGHAGAVLSASFDRENRFVVTGSADNTARLWNARTGQLLAELVGHSAGVYSVQFSQDGKSILTVGNDNTVRLYVCLECGRVEELLAESNKRLTKPQN